MSKWQIFLHKLFGKKIISCDIGGKDFAVETTGYVRKGKLVITKIEYTR